LPNHRSNPYRQDAETDGRDRTSVEKRRVRRGSFPNTQRSADGSVWEAKEIRAISTEVLRNSAHNFGVRLRQRARVRRVFAGRRFQTYRCSFVFQPSMARAPLVFDNKKKSEIHFPARLLCTLYTCSACLRALPIHYYYSQRMFKVR